MQRHHDKGCKVFERLFVGPCDLRYKDATSGIWGQLKAFKVWDPLEDVNGALKA